MHVVLRCPCGANLQAHIKYVGREMKCPKCSAKLIVPQPPIAEKSEAELLELEAVSTDDPVQTAATPLPSPKTSVGTPPLVPAHQSAIVSHGDAQPKTPTTRKSHAQSWIITGSLVLVAAVAFAGFLFVSYALQRSELASDSTRMRNDIKAKVENMRANNQLQSTPTPSSPPAAKNVAPIPPAKKNPFDTGKKDLNDPSIPVSDKDLDMADLIELVEPSIVRLKVESEEGDRVGSGAFIDREGKIVTNFHVVQGASTITVSTADGKQTEALGFLTAKPEQDLAIIQIDPGELNVVPAPVAKELPRKGEPVAAFGAPQGFSFTATKGIVSGIRSGEEVRDVLKEMSRVDIYKTLGYSTDTTWIQTTAAISGGNSGGPLVNMRGELIGVNTWTHPGGQNLNFASTAEEVTKIFQDRNSDLNDFQRLPTERIRFRRF